MDGGAYTNYDMDGKLILRELRLADCQSIYEAFNRNYEGLQTIKVWARGQHRRQPSTLFNQEIVTVAQRM